MFLAHAHIKQVKKAAEKAWEADKDKEDAHSIKHLPRKPVIGSTKRVEQFRKNLRRWMTGRELSSHELPAFGSAFIHFATAFLEQIS